MKRSVLKACALLALYEQSPRRPVELANRLGGGSVMNMNNAPWDLTRWLVSAGLATANRVNGTHTQVSITARGAAVARRLLARRLKDIKLPNLCAVANLEAEARRLELRLVAHEGAQHAATRPASSVAIRMGIAVNDDQFTE